MADQKVREMEPVETQIVEIMPPDIENLIYVVRNKQVMVDSDLAMLYQVETGALNRAVKRNIARFPEDFRFQLTKDEYENLKCQFGTSNGSGTENGYGGRRTLPYVFTEQGISMLASVLHSEVAINVSIGIMRAFVEMRRFIANNALLFERISNVELKQLEYQIAGGIMLLIFKPFQVGDYIIIAQQNGCEGTVYKIEICYTTLISIDNKHIVIPNGTLSGSIITNVTARDLRKLEIKVGISYDSDIKKAKAILEEILHNDEDTKDDQGMVVFVDELGESAVVMGLRVWVATEKYWPARWRLNELIKEAFDANGIEIPYNQLQVHVKKQI